MRYYDIESNKILSASEMRDLYESEQRGYSFPEFVTNCHPANNGSIVNLSDVADFKLVRDDNDGYFEFVEKSSWLWYTFIFDFSDCETIETAREMCEKEIKNEFGKDTLVNWNYYNEFFD